MQVLVSGDRDFIPALLRTRERGKRVAVCSMRNSASAAWVKGSLTRSPYVATHHSCSPARLLMGGLWGLRGEEAPHLEYRYGYPG